MKEEGDIRIVSKLDFIVFLLASLCTVLFATQKEWLTACWCFSAALGYYRLATGN